MDAFWYHIYAYCDNDISDIRVYLGFNQEYEHTQLLVHLKNRKFEVDTLAYFKKDSLILAK